VKEFSARRGSRDIRNKQQSQETHVHALTGIRTLNPSSRAPADLHFKPHVHRDQRFYITARK